MRLAIIERGPEQETADRTLPPVVFLHGLFGRARNFGFFQRRLATTRRTLALDLRNHGASPHGRADYPDMAEDVYKTLAAHDALPAVIVGHSMGGKTAMMLALRHADSVTRLLVADIAPGRGGFEQSSSLAADLAALSLPTHLNRAEADVLLTPVLPDSNVRSLILQNLELGDNPHWTIGIQDIAQGIPNIVGWPDLPVGTEYDGPTLFVAGGRSNYIQPANYPVMRHLFPHYELAVIEEAGHWVHAEQPQEFLRILQNFVDG